MTVQLPLPDLPPRKTSDRSTEVRAIVRDTEQLKARIMALECEVDALKSANARLEKADAERARQIADIRAQLGIGETR